MNQSKTSAETPAPVKDQTTSPRLGQPGAGAPTPKNSPGKSGGTPDGNLSLPGNGKAEDAFPDPAELSHQIAKRSRETNSVTCHKRNPVMPVPLRPARQPAATLRGYLNNSRQASGSTGGGGARNRVFPGTTINAPAREWRASAGRPTGISQCGDPGTQARISRLNAAGSSPIANRPRQPT